MPSLFRLLPDVARAIELLEKLQESGDVPGHKLQSLKKVLQSEFCTAIREVGRRDAGDAGDAGDTPPQPPSRVFCPSPPKTDASAKTKTKKKDKQVELAFYRLAKHSTSRAARLLPAESGPPRQL